MKLAHLKTSDYVFITFNVS